MLNWINAVRSWLPPRASTRSVAGQDTWMQIPTLSGIPVTEETAAAFGDVYAAINILSRDVSSIPLNLMKREADGSRKIDYSNPIHDLIFHCPNDEMTAESMRSAQMWHLLTTGNAFAEIERDDYLRPIALNLLDPDKVQVRRTDKEKKLYYEIEGVRFLPADIIHVAASGRDGVIGRSPIRQCREEIGLGIATIKFGASAFGNGINTRGVITLPDSMDEVESLEYRKNIDRTHQGPYNASRFMILGGGAQFSATTISAEDAQFIESRKLNTDQICRIFRVPPSKMMNFDKSSYGTMEEVNAAYYLESLFPWLKQFESEYSRKLLTKVERRVWSIEHDESVTLRGRILDQANVDKIYRDMGVLNVDEIRARRGGGKVPGGDVRFVPLNMAPLEAVANASIETLKGVKSAPQLPPPDDTTDEVDATLLAADGDTINALRDVVRDVAKRMVKRETNALRSIAKKPTAAAIVEALDSYYGRELETLIDAFAPTMRAYGLVARKPSDCGAALVKSLGDSADEIRSCVEGPETAKALVALADRWDAEKPARIVSALAD